MKCLPPRAVARLALPLWVWLLVALLGCQAPFCVAAGAAPVATEESEALGLEGAAVRSLLERGHAAETGPGANANAEIAFDLYCQAARYGSLEALYRLGRMAMAGRGMPRDPAMAATLFGIAAANGHYGASRMAQITGLREERLPRCLEH